MDRRDATMFPSVGMRILSATIHFLGVTILAHLISRRAIPHKNFTLKDLSPPWICALLILIDSWLFIFSSGILTLGIGLEKNDESCFTGILLCIIFYGTSKLFIYVFLSERVHAVWRPDSRSRRLQCKAYVGCVLVVSGYCGVIGVLFYGRISFFGGDRGVCYIGLKKSATVALLTYDFFVNAFLTGLFLWPVMRSSFRNDRIKRLAVRTLWSALIALTTSCVNIAILTSMNGHQLGWVCLGSCGTDVIINAVMIYWVTLKPPTRHDRASRVPDFISPLNSKDGGPNGAGSSARVPGFVFESGYSKRESPDSFANMQIKATARRTNEDGELSTIE